MLGLLICRAIQSVGWAQRAHIDTESFAPLMPGFQYNRPSRGSVPHHSGSVEHDMVQENVYICSLYTWPTAILTRLTFNCVRFRALSERDLIRTCATIRIEIDRSRCPLLVSPRILSDVS